MPTEAAEQKSICLIREGDGGPTQRGPLPTHPARGQTKRLPLGPECWPLREALGSRGREDGHGMGTKVGPLSLQPE